MSTFQFVVTVSTERESGKFASRDEISDLGRALETMRSRLEGKQYVEQYDKQYGR